MIGLQTNKGYTLIEVVIAAGLFSGALLVMSGVFTNFIVTERRDIAEHQLQEEIRFGLELFSREARTAYASTYAVNASGTQVTFRNQEGTCVSYRVQNSAWQRGTNSNSGTCESLSYNNYDTLHSGRTTIQQMRFLIPTSIAGGGELLRQGFITVSLRAAAVGTVIAPLSLQTTISSRQVVPYSGS
jgi:type II secretory pathway pseudopilin PulG